MSRFANRRFPYFVSAAAAAALVVAPVSMPSAHALTEMTVANGDGSVACQVVVSNQGTTTLCVSQVARQSQPECNPPEHQIPAISLNPGFAGTHCWNQGFEYEPPRLAPLQLRSHGSATVIPWLDGSLYVFDAAKLSLIKAGSVNRVVFSFR